MKLWLELPGIGKRRGWVRAVCFAVLGKAQRCVPYGSDGGCGRYHCKREAYPVPLLQGDGVRCSSQKVGFLTGVLSVKELREKLLGGSQWLGHFTTVLCRWRSPKHRTSKDLSLGHLTHSESVPCAGSLPTLKEPEPTK